VSVEQPSGGAGSTRDGPSSRLRVTLLNPTYWPEVRRGAERMVRELADGLIERDHCVRLITTHHGIPRREVEDAMRVLRLWRPPATRLTRRLYEEHLLQAPFSYLALRAGSQDVAHALAPADAVAAARWARQTPGVAIFSYMGIPTRRFLVGRRMRLKATLAACWSADAVVALSRAAADAFWETLGVRAPVIHPGVNVDWFSPGVQRSEEPLIFCNAPLALEYKRVPLLLRAMPIVRRSKPETRLMLMRPPDEALAARLEADHPWLELAIPQPGEDDALLLECYRRSWVSVLPSLGEAFGLVLAESLACGTPVVGTASGGIPEIIDRPEVGRLFEGDEVALARALLEALELSQAPGTLDACRARGEELSTRRAAESYEALYRDLLLRT
jgi:glycosyltransferase involved in cell wall biosynthesis